MDIDIDMDADVHICIYMYMYVSASISTHLFTPINCTVTVKLVSSILTVLNGFSNISSLEAATTGVPSVNVNYHCRPPFLVFINVNMYLFISFV